MPSEATMRAESQHVLFSLVHLGQSIFQAAAPDGWRKIAIALTDPDFGEQTAQSGENA